MNLEILFHDIVMDPVTRTVVEIAEHLPVILIGGCVVTAAVAVAVVLIIVNKKKKKND